MSRVFSGHFCLQLSQISCCACIFYICVIFCLRSAWWGSSSWGGWCLNASLECFLTAVNGNVVCFLFLIKIGCLTFLQSVSLAAFANLIFFTCFCIYLRHSLLRQCMIWQAFSVASRCLHAIFECSLRSVYGTVVFLSFKIGCMS